MNLFALVIHLLLFPFGNDGYTSRSWAWDIWFGDCGKECDWKEGGIYTCGSKRKSGIRCSCWNCQRDCQLSEASVYIDHCNAAASHVAKVGVDVGAHLASLTTDLAIGLVGASGKKGAIVAPILSFYKGIFEIGDDEKLLNSVIADVNARLDTMNKCMGQMIAMAQVEDQIDSMQRAFILYDYARSHQGNANDDQMDKLRSAWEEHVLVSHSEFDNVAKSADYFSKLLLPMQDFAQSFVLISFDYLIHLHELDEANYEDAYERTVDAFRQLRTWADKARDVIKTSISNSMHTLPCKNWQAIENEKNNWNAKFLSTNVYPIDSYIDRLAKLNNVFTGDLFSWLGCYKDTGDRAMVHLKNGVNSITECYDLCMRNGYYLFGLQYPPAGECFCSNNKGEATQFGESDNCFGRGRGGGWALDIYQMTGIRIGNVELHFGVVYAIKSVSSGAYLDGRSGGNFNYNNPLVTNRNPKGDKYLHWTIVPTNVENQFALKSVSSGFYLDGRNQNYNNPLVTNRDPTDDYYLQWTFEKTNGATYTTEYIGCYIDTANPRALRYGPHKYGYTRDTCSAACKAYKYFALQHGGWCCCDWDIAHATRYGEGGGCPASKMGAAARNDLFLNNKMLSSYSTYEHIGCYKDTGNRALRHGPHKFGYTPDTCSTACKDYKYFALQAGGWCCCEDDYDHATRYGEGGGCPASKMGAGWRNDLFLNDVPRSYTTYENKQCVGSDTDILRDFQGTVAECKAKCDELDCIGFIRIHSGAPQQTGRCYFRGGEMQSPYDYTSDDRDCYVPGTNNVAIKSVSSQKYLNGRHPIPNYVDPQLTIASRNPIDDKYLQWQFIAQ